MRHIKLMSRQRPSLAQFEPILQLLGVASTIMGLLSSALALLNQASQIFGFEIPQKEGEEQ